MTRSYTVTNRKPPSRVSRSSERSASVTNLGFACFRLIPIDDHAVDEPAYAWIRVQHTRNAMMPLMRLGPSKRQQFMRRIDTLDRVLDRVLQASLQRG